jgi:hypothetical protein
MTKVVAISEELHQFLARAKIKGGPKLTPQVFLDYLIFGMDHEAREEIVETIIRKASVDGPLKRQIAKKVKDNMVG